MHMHIDTHIHIHTHVHTKYTTEASDIVRIIFKVLSIKTNLTISYTN